jgi:hypothetical protein
MAEPQEADGGGAAAAAPEDKQQQPVLPRKGAYSKHVQALHKDQLAKLQAKSSQEIDLLEQIRSFVKAKASLEKSYAEGLLKISTSHLNHKLAAIPDIQKDDDEQVKT